MQMKFLITVFLLAIGAQTFAQHTLTVEVKSLRNTKGSLYFSLFKSETGFPDKHESAIQKGKLEGLKSTTATYVFKNIPDGTYAVAIFHDESNDGEMKTNALGIPLEGTAVSNDAKGTFGPPKYKDAKFTLGGDKKIVIKMWYF